MKRITITMLLLFAGSQPRLEAVEPSKWKPFLESYCIDCHGPETQKAGLRLDTLGTDDAAMARWVAVHDKIKSGAMPPKKSDQPSRAEAEAITKALHDQLHAASMAQQQSKGRVVLRRLNATEYENTIRDLVGTQVRLKEMLPEESSVAGFDNVSAALDFSATHMMLYQEAAEKAVLSTVPQHPNYPIKQRWTGKQIADRGSNFNQTLGRSCRVEGDSLLVYSKLPRYGLCATESVRGSGTYRIRMSIAAVGAEKKPFPVGLMILESSGREDAVLHETRDIPHGESRIIEIDIPLNRRQAFVMNLLTRWDIRDFKRPLEEYTGPGVRMDWLEIEGPIGPFPPASYNTLFQDVPLKARSVAKAEREKTRVSSIDNRKTPDSWVNDPLEPASTKPREDAERLIRSFLPRAFRRPVPESITKLYVDRVHQKLDEKYSFFDAMAYGYRSILTSPHFLLFTEAAPGKLDDYALASRLSYFLWSGPPDAALIAAAAKGDLSRPTTLRSQVERMLADPKAHRLTENFTGQWLDLRKIDATIPDPQLYGDFDGILLAAMPKESHSVFEEILKNDRSLLEFIDSDWTMLNERLARHYGIPGVQGNEFRKVPLPKDSHRGGVLTQASVLKVTADGTRTSPVLRGKWVLEKILGQPPAPPPPDVPSIEPDIRGATTIRQQLDKHRQIASCASCHNHIDPPGFALETFDPIGGYRDYYRATTGDRKNILKVSFHSGRPIYRGPDVELGSEMNGQAFRTIEEFKKVLLHDKDQLARNLAEKLLIYSTGAEIQFADREVIEDLVGKVRSKNYGFRTLVHEVVQSRAFLNK